MWLLFACSSAVFAGLTAILAKCGIRETDSTVATAVRTIVVLGFSWRCYYKALQNGPASVVVPVDKLSILIKVFFLWIVFGEKLCCCEELLDTEEEFVEDAAGQHI